MLQASSSLATTSRRESGKDAVPHTRVEGETMLYDHYQVGNKIGEGSFGKVYEAVHIETNVRWAIKSLNKDKASSTALKHVEREVSILKKVNHPHIINLKEVIESAKRMYLVMELCTGGELADVLTAKEYFTEEETKILMTRLCSAISYLHKHAIVHRDLKLENILLADNPDDPNDKLYIKVGDFGLSVMKGGTTTESMMQDVCGTPIYMAPEVLDNKTYSQQCDVWALGIIMYYLLCGHPPFCTKEETLLYDLIREADVKFSDEVWKGVSEEAKNCIHRMLKLDPAHRISAAEVLNHPWITGVQQDASQPTNVLEMMKMWKDELRNTDDEHAPSSSLDKPQTEPEQNFSDRFSSLPNMTGSMVAKKSGGVKGGTAGVVTSTNTFNANTPEKVDLRKSSGGKQRGVTDRSLPTGKISLSKTRARTSGSLTTAVSSLSSPKNSVSFRSPSPSTSTGIVSSTKNESANCMMRNSPAKVTKSKKK